MGPLPALAGCARAELVEQLRQPLFDCRVPFDLALPAAGGRAALLDAARSELLHPDDPQLRTAQQAAFAVLGTTVTAASVDQHLDKRSARRGVSLIAWAFVHGLVVLTRDGALHTVAATPTRRTPPTSPAASPTASPPASARIGLLPAPIRATRTAHNCPSL